MSVSNMTNPVALVYDAKGWTELQLKMPESCAPLKDCGRIRETRPLKRNKHVVALRKMEVKGMKDGSCMAVCSDVWCARLAKAIDTFAFE